MAARIVNRLNWMSRRFYAAAVDSSKMTLAEKEAAESKHAECKLITTLAQGILLKREF